MKKRNRRTEIMAHMELSPLTEHILATMGQEGDAIRKRLKNLYRRRACQPIGLMEEYIECSV